MNQFPAASDVPAAPHKPVSPEDEEGYRKLCDWLEHWRHCSGAACRRAHRCEGVPHRCFIHHWARYPDAVKKWIDTFVRVRDRRSAREATDAADFALVLHLKKEAGLPLFPRERRGRAGGK